MTGNMDKAVVLNGSAILALRNSVLRRHVRMTYGGGEAPSGGSCSCCKQEWGEQDSERHTADCALLLAESALRTVALPHLGAQREEEVEASELVCFLALWAVRYQADYGFDGLHPVHYDLMKKHGARMEGFKRATNAPSPPAEGE